MAKKFGKLVLFGTLVGAAAAGTYYYLQNKSNTQKDVSDDFDDFDDFDEDLDNEDFSDDAGNNSGSSRPYVSLDIDNAKEIIGEKVIETLDKTKEKIEQFNVSEKIDKAKELIGEMTAPASDAESVGNTDKKSVSATYAEPPKPENTTENFFDDSEE